jgi:hypothetical protein
MPALYLLAAFAIGILYWVDKYHSKILEYQNKFIVFRFYSNPMRLDHRLILKTQVLIPYSILLHLAFAILIYGSIGLAPPASGNYGLYLGDFIKNDIKLNNSMFL